MRGAALRLVVLGSNYNPFSVSCLSGLVEAGIPVTGVAIDDAARSGFGATVRTALARHGGVFVARRAVDLFRARLRLARLRAGSSPAGTARSLEEVALSRRIPCRPVPDVNGERSRGWLASLAPDILLVAGFGQILRQHVIGLPRVGCLNVHPSLLPEYRGPNPLYWVLERRERRTGVTVHILEARVDAGPVVVQEAVDIAADDTERSLRDRTGALAARMLPPLLEQIAREGVIHGEPQDESRASYFPLPPRGRSTL